MHIRIIQESDCAVLWFTKKSWLIRIFFVICVVCVWVIKKNQLFRVLELYIFVNHLFGNQTTLDSLSDWHCRFIGYWKKMTLMVNGTKNVPFQTQVWCYYSVFYTYLTTQTLSPRAIELRWDPLIVTSPSLKPTLVNNSPWLSRD